MPLPLNTDSQGVPYLAYDSTRDAVYSEGLTDVVVAAGITFTQTNGTFNYVASRSSIGYTRRAITYYNSTDKVLTITITFYPANSAFGVAILTHTVAIGNATPQYGIIDSSGAFPSNGAAPTKTLGDYSFLTLPSGGTGVINISGSTTAATVGVSEVDLIQCAF